MVRCSHLYGYAPGCSHLARVFAISRWKIVPRCVSRVKFAFTSKHSRVPRVYPHYAHTMNIVASFCLTRKNDSKSKTLQLILRVFAMPVLIRPRLAMLRRFTAGNMSIMELFSRIAASKCGRTRKATAGSAG